jgi:hypothetical protein
VGHTIVFQPEAKSMKSARSPWYLAAALAPDQNIPVSLPQSN